MFACGFATPFCNIIFLPLGALIRFYSGVDKRFPKKYKNVAHILCVTVNNAHIQLEHVFMHLCGLVLGVMVLWFYNA